jgi:hypothetical protein
MAFMQLTTFAIKPGGFRSTVKSPYLLLPEF